MNAGKIPVKTMEPVMTLSTATNANVLLDLTTQIVKTVRTLIALFVDGKL